MKTRGNVRFQVFGPPVQRPGEPSKVPGLGLDDIGQPIAPGPQVMVDGRYRPVGPTGHPLLIPPGEEAHGPREMVADSFGGNLVTEWFQWCVFANSLGYSGGFSDGTNTYTMFELLDGVTNYLGLYVSATQLPLPTSPVSYITAPGGDTFIVASSINGYVVPSGPPFSVSSFDWSYTQTSATLTSTLVANNSFNVGQVGFTPCRYVTTGELDLVVSAGTAPYQFTTSAVTSPSANYILAMSTLYTAPQVYTVPVGGAITITYGLTANYS